MGAKAAASQTGAFGRLLAAFGVFLLGYMIVAVGRPVALAVKAVAETAAVRAKSALRPTKGGRRDQTGLTPFDFLPAHPEPIVVT